MALKKPTPSCRTSNTPPPVICSFFSASFFNIENNISCFLNVLGFSIPSFSAEILVQKVISFLILVSSYDCCFKESNYNIVN